MLNPEPHDEMEEAGQAPTVSHLRILVEVQPGVDRGVFGGYRVGEVVSEPFFLDSGSVGLKAKLEGNPDGLDHPSLDLWDATRAEGDAESVGDILLKKACHLVQTVVCRLVVTAADLSLNLYLALRLR